MDRLISLEPSNHVPVRIEAGRKCSGELTLRNVMHTMPVAFRIQAMIKTSYAIKPQSGIIPPLGTVTVEIVYHLQPGSNLPDYFPHSPDSFLLHSVVVPGATIKESSSSFDAIPADWFTTKKKQVFIDSGIKIMFVGSSVLAKLVAEGSMEEIREVLEKSDPEWKSVDSLDVNGQTLLHLAIAQGRADLVQLLLEFGPEMDARSKSGTTPLEAASAAGEALIAELLLARGASTERSESSCRGPIHLAVAEGHMEVLRLLLLKGADVNSLCEDGSTALRLAVDKRRRDCARLLLANGAITDLKRIKDGQTPLHRAAWLGDESMVKLLLQKGANKDIRNKSGKMAYDLAAEQGHTRLFDMLRLADQLAMAAREGDVRKIQKLLECGAAINGRDQYGWTALHRAAFKGRTEAVRALVDKGIDINSKDEDGYTTLHCAVEAGHAEVTELLVKRGADTEARTNKNVTALQIAESLRYTGIARILIHGGAMKDFDNVLQVSSSPKASLSFERKPLGREGLKKKKQNRIFV